MSAWLQTWGLVLVCPAVMGLLLGLYWWTNRRWWRRWTQDQAAYERQRALQAQLWAMEDQIRRESLPDWEREAYDAVDRRRAAIRQEARRRLGLPEEDPPAC